jgi:hypothetical protein
MESRAATAVPATAAVFLFRSRTQLVNGHYLITKLKELLKQNRAHFSAANAKTRAYPRAEAKTPEFASVVASQQWVFFQTR